VFYIVARSVAQGPLAGLVSVLGVALGASAHVAAAALGVSALVLASAEAFVVLKWLGAAYLVWLGIRAFAVDDEAAPGAPVRRRRLVRVFADGVVVNLLNPKTALFFLAFLPQFVDPHAGSVPLQMLVLGALFVAIGLASDGVYALVAGGLAMRLRESAAARRTRRWFSGCVYIGLGAMTALAEPAAAHGGEA